MFIGNTVAVGVNEGADGCNRHNDCADSFAVAKPDGEAEREPNARTLGVTHRLTVLVAHEGDKDPDRGGGSDVCAEPRG